MANYLTEEERASKSLYSKYLNSKEFSLVKDAVFARDGYRCVCCHRTEWLQCHHTEYTHLGCGDEREINDCITLCSTCHSAISRATGNLGRWRDKHFIIINLEER